MIDDEVHAVPCAYEMDNSLEVIAAQFKTNVEVKDRKYRFQTYHKCFVGKEAVDYMVNERLASNREEAVQLGQSIMEELSLFEHVTRDHPFADEYLFYHFIDRGDVSINETTGKKFSWDDYLDPVSSNGVGSLQPSLPQPDLECIPEEDVHVASHVWPLDEHNVTLLNHVHPTGWQDPDPQNKFDLVVIGGGAAGLVTSSGAAGVGARVALIEANLLGGDCLNVGCVPSKSLIHAAHLAHTTKNTSALADSGISVGQVRIDFPKIMERIRRVRAEISHHDSADRFTKELGVEVYLGRATFVDPHSVEVNGKILRFNKAVIATGGYPSLIPMPGLKELHALNTNPGDKPRPYVMTNETFFNMTAQPKNLVVIGPGVIGLEMAQSMARLGTNVTVMGRSGRVLPKEDEDHALIIQQSLESDGCNFKLNVSEYVSVETTGTVLDNGLPELSFKIAEEIDGETVVSELFVDAVLVATGRRPNVTGMGLEAAGVEYDTRVGVIVNDRLQSTSNSNVWAAGDCASSFKFTHAADFMARTVIRNSLFFGKDKMSSLLIPYATFTEPEIASVGLYGTDLDEKGIKYRTFEKPFDQNDRSICDGTTTGGVRIRVEEKTDKILGATIIGQGAGNMISEITLAMQSGTGLGALAAVVHPYPTNAEAIRQAGDLYNRTKLTPTVKAILRGLIKVQRPGVAVPKLSH
mmetsp:Transcript_35418/g.79486  ORF Transcript_35418/g.79486 Transcript_35418/m.79486 type:complete len:694 (-) Transcript_35418:174-2255(-)